MSAVRIETDYQDVSCNNCNSDEHDFRYQLNQSAIVSCRQCGLSFVTPRVSSAWIYQKLQQWAEIDTVDEERLRIAFDDATLKLYRRYLNWLDRDRRHLNSKERGILLDVGCSVGAFLSQAKSYNYKTQGLEIGEASARYARKQQLDIVNDSINETNLSDDSYQVITMMEVIEHLEDPLSALRKLSKALSSDGQILITTPNFNSLYRRLFGARWWVINCEDEHIYFFTEKSLIQMLEQAGFEASFIFYRGYDFVGMLKQILKREKNSPESEAVTPCTDENYYSSRQHKEKIKTMLGKLGLLKALRALLYGLDWLSSQRWSPLYGLAEQMIIIAKKR